MKRNLIVTGFLPFGENKVNPSQIVAEHLGTLGFKHIIFPVEYQAVEVALEKISEEDSILLFGLAANRSLVTLERYAHNEYGSRPDEKGVIRNGRIEEIKALYRESCFDVDGLVKRLNEEGVSAEPSLSAGRYLCNYAYYRCLQKSAGKALFVHLPLMGEGDPNLIRTGEILVKSLMNC